MDEFGKLVNTLDYQEDDVGYKGVVNFNKKYGFVDIDRVNVNLDDAFEKHQMVPTKIKEDVNEGDGVVRVWFEPVSMGVDST